MDDKLIPTLVLPGDEEEAQQAAAEAEAPVQEAAQPFRLLRLPCRPRPSKRLSGPLLRRKRRMSR